MSIRYDDITIYIVAEYTHRTYSKSCQIAVFGLRQIFFINKIAPNLQQPRRVSKLKKNANHVCFYK